MNKHTLFTVASFLFCTQVSGDTPDGNLSQRMDRFQQEWKNGSI